MRHLIRFVAALLTLGTAQAAPVSLTSPEFASAWAAQMSANKVCTASGCTFTTLPVLPDGSRPISQNALSAFGYFGPSGGKLNSGAAIISRDGTRLGSITDIAAAATQAPVAFTPTVSFATPGTASITASGTGYVQVSANTETVTVNETFAVNSLGGASGSLQFGGWGPPNNQSGNIISCNPASILSSTGALPGGVWATGKIVPTSGNIVMVLQKPTAADVTWNPSNMTIGNSSASPPVTAATYTVSMTCPNIPIAAPAATAPTTSAGTTLVADGTVAATLNGNTFAWANQPSGATVIGGDSGSTTSVLNITAQPHTSAPNQAMLKAKMPTGSWTWTIHDVQSDPSGYYSSGPALLNTATGANTLLYTEGSSASGTNYGVETESNFAGASSSYLTSLQYPPWFPLHQTKFERFVYDGTTLTIEASASGTANNWMVIWSGTLAALGNPNDLGIYEDAYESAAQENYVGYANFISMSLLNTASPQVAAIDADATQTFLTAPIYPNSDTLPTITGLQPPDGVTLPSGTPNGFAAIFGTQTTNANFTTVQGVFGSFYTYFDEGNLNASIGSPNDTGQGDNTTFAAVARTYAPADPMSVHTMLSDGLLLSNNCSANRTYCYPGLIYGAMLDTPGGNPILPGSLTMIRTKVGTGQHKWTPIWTFSNQRLLHGTKDSTGYGQYTFSMECNGKAPSASTYGTGGCYELDINDYFSRLLDGNTPVGQEVVFWTPNYGYGYTTAAHWTYMANTTSFTDKQVNEQYEQLNSFNCSSNFCDFFLNWRNDGTNLLDILVAPVTSPATPAKLIESVYMEFHPLNNGSGGTPLGLNLIVSAAQAIPGASLNGGVLPTYSSIVQDDGVTNGWSIEVQAIENWPAAIPNQDAYKPSN